MSHTPGPWEERDGMLVSVSTGTIVCDPYEPNPQDAPILKAAPDLLVALERIRALIRAAPPTGEGRAAALGQAAKVARLAITKAWGES